MFGGSQCVKDLHYGAALDKMTMGKTFNHFFFVSLLAVSIPALAQTDPLDSAYMPSIDQNPANYPSNIWITGPLAKVLRNTGTPGALHWAVVYAMRNETQSFQVHVQAPAGGIPNLSVTMSDLVNARTSSRISAASTDIVVYRQAYQNITFKTATGVTFLNTTGFIPDILIPAVDPYYHQTTNAFPFNVAGNQNQSVWIDVHVPTNAPSGYYSGTVTVASGGTVLAVMPVVYGVWAWQMPSTSSLPSYTEVGYGGFCLQAYGSISGCGAYPGAGGDSDLGVTLNHIDIAVQMLDNRFSLGALTNIYPESGSFETFDAMYGPLFNGTNANVRGILQGAKLTSYSLRVLGDVSSSAATVQNFATHFTAKGWFPTIFNYLCDEPPMGCSWSTLVSNGNLEHTYSTPIIPNLVTASIAAAAANGALNAIDWLVPIVNELDPQGGTNQRSSYDNWLNGNSRRRLWSYQSCESAGTCTNGYLGTSNATWPNYNVDGTPVANRAMEWLTFRHNQSGELYYFADICSNTLNYDCGHPAKAANSFESVYYAGGHGDGTLVYPASASYAGTATPIWLPSLRLKMIRDGMQDYEYLRALSNSGESAFVTAQINSWITNSYTFNNNPSALSAARQALGTKLHQITYPGTIDTTPPSVPSGLRATSLSSTQINVSWTASTDNVGVTGYKVLRGAVQIATATTTSFVDVGLTPSTTYSYSVSAFDVWGNVSAQASAVSTRTAPAGDTVLPGIGLTSPANGATLTGTIVVTGNATDDVAVSGVQVSVDGGGYQNATGTATWTFSLNTRDLSNGAHTLRARAIDSSGNVSATVTISFTASNDLSDVTAPSIPTPVSATAVSSTQINVSWSASTDNVGVTGYKVFRGGIQVSTRATTSFSDGGRTPSTTYTYTVAAFDAAGNVSAQSVAVSTRTLPAAADTLAPSVVLSSPRDGDTVRRKINILATATDNVAVSRVEFYVDSQLLSSDSLYPYAATWHTQHFASGVHTLMAKAVDTSGNSAQSAISVTVGNNSVSGSDYYTPSFTWIDSAQGAAIADEDTQAQLIVPAGAVAPSTQTTISMTPLNPLSTVYAQLQGLSLRAQNLASAGNWVDLGPEGLNFSAPVGLSLAVSPCVAGTNLYYWNPTVRRWQTVSGSTFDQAACRVSGQLAHFSIYAPLYYSQQSTTELPSVYVFPNPVRRNDQPTFHIEAGSGESAEINVYNAAGQLLHQQTVAGPPSVITRAQITAAAYEATWNASQIGSGVYFYVVKVHRRDRTDVAKGQFAIIR